MRVFVATLVSLSAFVLGCMQPAQAGSDGWETCVKDQSIPPNDRIAGCTRVIESGVWQGENLGLAFYVRGFTRNLEDDPTGALSDLDRAMDLRPTDISVMITRSSALRALQRPDEAIDQLDRALVLQPNAPKTLNSRCWTRAQFDRELDKAMADCNAALALEPDNPAFLDSRGLVNLRAKRWDAAIDDYTAALEGAPGLPWALYGRGIARIRLGDTEGGRVDLEAGKASWDSIEAAYDAIGIQP